MVTHAVVPRSHPEPSRRLAHNKYDPSFDHMGHKTLLMPCKPVPGTPSGRADAVEICCIVLKTVPITGHSTFGHVGVDEPCSKVIEDSEFFFAHDVGVWIGLDA